MTRRFGESGLTTNWVTPFVEQVFLYLLVFMPASLWILAGEVDAEEFNGQSTPLIDSEAFQLSGSYAKSGSVFDRVVRPGDANKSFYRIQTFDKPPTSWSVQLRTVNTQPVSRGEVLLARCRARCVESMVGEGSFEYIFERQGPGWEKLLAFHATVGPEWTEINIPFKSSRDLKPGEAQANIRLGYPRQTIEISDIELVSFGRNYPIHQLPATKRTYKGIEPDASWRLAAERRIEKFRQADIHVLVTDDQGQPVPNARVAIEMTHHGFGFGSAVVAKLISSGGESNEQYRQIIEEYFNQVVFENDLKWGRLRGNLEHVDKAMNWLEENSIDVRGHTLIWPSWKHVPRNLRNLRNDPPRLRQRIAEHFEETAGRFAGRLLDWDVVNEVYSNHDIVDILGDEVLVDWFKHANGIDPHAKLFINDYGILTANGRDEIHQATYEKTIRRLLSSGAPLHGIGMQGHFSSSLTSPSQLLKVLDRFAAHKLPIKVTEFDVAIDDEELQAKYVRDFLTVMYSHPAVDAVVIWGFWEDRHWKQNAAWWRSDFTPKPVVREFERLFREQWWTREAGVTDRAGRYQTRGHLGDYTITIETSYGEESQEMQLGREGTEIVIALREEK